jgi:hypothetical protein
MDGKLSRRNLIKSAAAVAGLDKPNDVAAAASTDSAAESASNTAIVPLTSTSDVFVPPHGGGMFGTNTANRELPEFSKFSDATTSQIDGDAFNLNWVDGDNDRHTGVGPISEFSRGVLAKLAARAHRGDHRDRSRRRVFSGYRGRLEK